MALIVEELSQLWGIDVELTNDPCVNVTRRSLAEHTLTVELQLKGDGEKLEQIEKQSESGTLQNAMSGAITKAAEKSGATVTVQSAAATMVTPTLPPTTTVTVRTWMFDLVVSQIANFNGCSAPISAFKQ